MSDNIKNELIIAFFIALLFFVISLLLPVYDRVNGFHNLIFDQYELIFHDGISPINFHSIKKLLEGKPPYFEEDYDFGPFQAQECVGLITINGVYKPAYNMLHAYLYKGVLGFFHFTSELELFKSIVTLNTLFFSLILSIFYLIQRSLGLKSHYSILSTFISGFSTSILIYSKYLFLQETLWVLALIITLYLILRNRKRSTRKDITISLSFACFLLLFYYQIWIVGGFFVLFFLVCWRFDVFRSKKIFVLAGLIPLLLMRVWMFSFFGAIPIPFTTITKRKLGDVLLYNIYPEYIDGQSYSVFGYHDMTDPSKYYRSFSYVYGFEKGKGNAIFLFSHALFQVLFGPKGFISNSPFLIFSIFGILLYKNSKKRNFILYFILAYLFLFGIINVYSGGGLTPRYMRRFHIPILFLSFFSFYFFQESNKGYLKVLFLILVVLSILNVVSLTIRMDWSYEHPEDLVSYDLVLWPWYPSRPIYLYLTEQSEFEKWDFAEEDKCKAYGSLEGITTDVCNCEYVTYAERNIEIPWEKVRVNVTTCGRNGDGVVGKFHFDETEKEIFIPPDSCKKESMLIENLEGEHSIVLESKRYSKCIDETIIWKLIIIEKV